MDSHTRSAKEWLERRYRRKLDGSYRAHQPIHGLRTQHSEPNAVMRLARTYRILTLLQDLEFDSFLDVGGGEGYVSGLVADLFGVTASTTDLAEEACLRASELFGVRGVAADATLLPLRAQSVDLVLCSEVIEHLSRPVQAMEELMRVARKHVVLTTAETCPSGELERALRMWSLDYDYPHAERNWFTLRDFHSILGSDVLAASQMRNLGGRISTYFGDRALSRTQTEVVLDYLTATRTLDLNHDGIVLVWTRPDYRTQAGRQASPEADAAARSRILDRLLEPPARATPAAPEAQEFDRSLLEILQCPACAGTVDLAADQITCGNCGRAYPVRGGVAVLTVDDQAEAVSHRPPRPVGGFASSRRAYSSVIRRLHGPRPLTTNRWVRKVSRVMLRALIFAKRPESARHKLRRLAALIRKARPIDFQELDERLSVAGLPNLPSIAGTNTPAIP